MRDPEIRDWAWLKEISAPGVVVWASASVRERVADELPLSRIASFDEIPAGAGTLIVVGGGTLMDEAKHFRATQRPELRLILAPSIWGSGAEYSPIAVLNRAGAKRIAVGREFLPDAVVYWPVLLSTVSPAQARRACGDTWAHALEAFFSPLASDAVRGELACLIQEMPALPLASDASWFRVSARVSALQAQASVGLDHGIAHVLEFACRSRRAEEDWGHARLCSAFLLPVMNLNRAASDKWATLVRQHRIDETAIWNVLRELFEPDSCAAALPLLRENWTKILRDPCTRTNGALIRASHLAEMERQVAA
jgi:alcohol dehydrogenase class IV